MSGTYNDMKIVEMTHDENVFGMGAGTGLDMYFKERIQWLGFGLYFRFNYYNPYYAKASNMKIKSVIATPISISDGERVISNSLSFDINVGGIMRFKYKRFEIPVAFAVVFPRISKIDMELDELGKEGVADFGILYDIGAKYFFSDRFFATIGGRYGIGIAFGGFPDSRFQKEISISDVFLPSQIVAGYAGIGIKL
jgi:hypothetical protein